MKQSFTLFFLVFNMMMWLTSLIISVLDPMIVRSAVWFPAIPILTTLGKLPTHHIPSMWCPSLRLCRLNNQIEPNQMTYLHDTAISTSVVGTAHAPGWNWVSIALYNQLSLQSTLFHLHTISYEHYGNSKQTVHDHKQQC